jgi:hypothetical protein
MKIFISYSTKDEKTVRGLEKYISKEMIETWIDHKAIGGGSDLTKAIQKGIQRADIYFVFISLNSLESDWVDKEIKWAMQREEKLKYEFVVPVVLEIEALKRWDNKKLKDRKYIPYNGDFHVMAHEIKNTIVNKTIEKFEYQCLLKKDILSNIGNVILAVFLAILFFTTPSQKEHIKYLSNISTNCLSSQVKFNDMWFMTYASCPINNDKKLYSFGAFETILSREIQNDR